MEPIPASAELSVRRSLVRRRVLLLLASLGEAYVGQLARSLGVSHERVRWALLGRLPQYRPELSLVALGLAERVVAPTGTSYRITRRGLRKARSLARRTRLARIEPL